MTARTKIILASLSLAIALPAQAAFAQSVEAGAKVSDTQGAAVGTVASVDGDFVIVKTDKHEVRLPKASFTVTDSGLLFGMTQAELNAAVEQATVNPRDLLKAGAVVRDPAGGHVGTVESVEGDLATVKLATISVKLPVSAFAAGSEGLVLGMTAAELEAQAAATVEASAN